MRVGDQGPARISARYGSDRRVSRFYRGAAIIFVAYPIIVLLTRRPPLVEGLLVLVGAGLFGGLLAFASRQPGSPARAHPVGPALVLLLIVVATVLVVRDPSAGW